MYIFFKRNKRKIYFKLNQNLQFISFRFFSFISSSFHTDKKIEILILSLIKINIM